MNIELTPAQKSLIELGIQEGRYRDHDEAVRRALALSEERERTRLELLSSLGTAEWALDQGEGEAYSPENLGALVESVRKRGSKSLHEN